MTDDEIPLQERLERLNRQSENMELMTTEEREKLRDEVQQAAEEIGEVLQPLADIVSNDNRIPDAEDQ